MSRKPSRRCCSPSTPTPKPDFQRHCLALLTQAVDAGEADAGHLAYLTDRVLRAEGQPQRYGPQFLDGSDGSGSLQPQPIEDSDELRAAAGPGPFANYEQIMHEDLG